MSQIPIVGRLFGSNSTDREKSEIVLSITPHIIRTQARASAESTEFWYGTETRSRSSPFAGGGGFDSTAPAASSAGGDVSGGPGLPTVGPRPSVSQPVVVPSAAPVPTVTTTTTATPAGPPAAPSGPPPHPTVTVDGPSETTVGQEFEVTVRMATDIADQPLAGSAAVRRQRLAADQCDRGRRGPLECRQPDGRPQERRRSDGRRRIRRSHPRRGQPHGAALQSVGGTAVERDCCAGLRDGTVGHRHGERGLARR